MNESLSETFRENVMNILNQRGITKVQLSEMLGVHPSQVRVQMDRKGGHTLRTVERYAEVLNVSPLDLLRARVLQEVER